MMFHVKQENFCGTAEKVRLYFAFCGANGDGGILAVLLEGQRVRTQNRGVCAGEDKNGGARGLFA